MSLTSESHSTGTDLLDLKEYVSRCINHQCEVSVQCFAVLVYNICSDGNISSFLTSVLCRYLDFLDAAALVISALPLIESSALRLALFEAEP